MLSRSRVLPKEGKEVRATDAQILISPSLLLLDFQSPSHLLTLLHTKYPPKYGNTEISHTLLRVSFGCIFAIQTSLLIVNMTKTLW